MSTGRDLPAGPHPWLKWPGPTCRIQMGMPGFAVHGNAARPVVQRRALRRDGTPPLTDAFARAGHAMRGTRCNTQATTWARAEQWTLMDLLHRGLEEDHHSE